MFLTSSYIPILLLVMYSDTSRSYLSEINHDVEHSLLISLMSFIDKAYGVLSTTISNGASQTVVPTSDIFAKC
jgi:hypothetical protein